MHYISDMKDTKYNAIINLRVTEKMKSDLTRVAKLTKRKPSDVIRNIVEEWLQA